MTKGLLLLPLKSSAKLPSTSMGRGFEPKEVVLMFFFQDISLFICNALPCYPDTAEWSEVSRFWHLFLASDKIQGSQQKRSEGNVREPNIGPDPAFPASLTYHWIQIVQGIQDCICYTAKYYLCRVKYTLVQRTSMSTHHSNPIDLTWHIGLLRGQISLRVISRQVGGGSFFLFPMRSKAKSYGPNVSLGNQLGPFLMYQNCSCVL